MKNPPRYYQCKSPHFKRALICATNIDEAVHHFHRLHLNAKATLAGAQINRVPAASIAPPTRTFLLESFKYSREAHK